MATKGQLTGMTGVYLVAAQLSRRGFVVSPTSRSAHGVDLLASAPNGIRTLAFEVKTNARSFSFWLLGKKANQITVRSQYYVLVNLRKDIEEYFVVPSRIVAKRMVVKTRASGRSKWRFIYLKDIERYRDKWPFAGRGR
jgi:hypothetical protein